MAIKPYFLLILLSPLLCLADSHPQLPKKRPAYFYGDPTINKHMERNYLIKPAVSASAQETVSPTDYYHAISNTQEEFLQHYGKELCPQEGSVATTDTEDPDGEDGDKQNSSFATCSVNGGYYFANLKDSCRQAKTPATDCCQNPSACSSVIGSFATNILPVLPGLYSTIKGIKLNKQITSSELTTEEIQNKLCSMNNKTQMAGFAGGLLSQLMPALQKGCAGKIKRCQNRCGSRVAEFNEDFFNRYNFAKIKISGQDKDIRLSGAGDSRQLIELAKTCLFGNSLENFETLSIVGKHDDYPNVGQVSSGNTEEISIPVSGGCYWNSSDPNSPKILKNKVKEEDIPIILSKNPSEDEQNAVKILSSILFAAKAYYNTMGVHPEVRKKGRVYPFTFKEKEIVDCGYQPDRKISKRYTPGGPVPPPVMQACRAAVKEAVDQHKTPGRTPKAASAGPAGTTGESGMGGAETFVATKTDKSDPNPLLWGPGKGPNQPGLEDFDDPEERPSPSGKLASFGDSSNSGSSPGGGPGGGGLSPGGGGGGPMEDYPYGSDMYAGGVGELSGGFSDSSGYDAAGGYQEATTGEDPIALAQADDTEKDGFGTPDFGVGNYPGGAQDPSSEKTIFGMSSERIQNFCADRTCID